MGARRRRASVFSTMDYFLRTGLSFCRDGDRFVFLDVPRDRYFALTDSAARCFARLIEGAVSVEDEPQLQSLVESVLAGGGGSPIRAAVPPPCAQASLLDLGGRTNPFRDLLAWATFRRAILEVRYRGLDHLLTGLMQTKRGLGPELPSARLLCERAARSFRRVGNYASLSDRCLPYSIAVAHWLLSRGVNASLVIGVAIDPFQAHSWVQVDDVLINERVELVRDFLPILVI